MEYGNNYIKYDNGVMIEFGEFTISSASMVHDSESKNPNEYHTESTANTKTTFPVAFISIPSVTLMAENNYQTLMADALIIDKTYMGGFYIHRGTSTSSVANVKIHWLAIGRWK